MEFLKRRRQRKEDFEFEKLFDEYKNKRWYEEKFLEGEDEGWVLINVAKNRLPFKLKRSERRSNPATVNVSDCLIAGGVVLSCFAVGGGIAALFVLTNGNGAMIAAIIASVAGAFGGVRGGQGFAALHLFG